LHFELKILLHCKSKAIIVLFQPNLLFNGIVICTYFDELNKDDDDD